MDRLLLRVPDRCVSCRRSATVKPEYTIRGATAILKWCCFACGQDWPVDDGERMKDRRQATWDPRTADRSERRIPD